MILKKSLQSLSLVSVAVQLFQMQPAYAQSTASPQFQIATDEVSELPVETTKERSLDPFNGILENQPEPAKPSPLDEAEVTIDQLIRIGQKIYKVIEAGRPVYNAEFNRTDVVPKGITHWTQLTQWRAPQARRYERVIKNLNGITVIYFRYMIEYTPGGQYNGKGQFLQNVTIQPEEVYVAWGYRFDVNVSIPSLTNAGTADDPIAAAQLLLDSKISTVMNTLQSSSSYYVRGDGGFKSLQN
jgi:hypothetical protein